MPSLGRRKDTSLTQMAQDDQTAIGGRQQSLTSHTTTRYRCLPLPYREQTVATTARAGIWRVFGSAGQPLRQKQSAWLPGGRAIQSIPNS
jgi:hypothetical protein